MNDISAQIRARRRATGLSLSQAARRADTSPATLSRYENGWSRFEVYTLQKLATVLNCRLRIVLEPLQQTDAEPSPTEMVKRLGRLFWDRKLRTADLDNHPLWVLARVLDYGSLEDVHMLIKYTGRELFLERVTRTRFTSEKTREFWRQVLTKESTQCTKKHFQNTATSS